VRDIVAEPLVAYRTGDRAARRNRVDQVLELVGLDPSAHGGRHPRELSGGQAQRVALARGMVARPEVLFADEPTGSLDSVSGELVMDLLTAAAREHGTTVILVTHDARVAAYADREVVVRDGVVGTLTGAKP
jgi:putative ABC transport system ATP-binding protein